MQYIFTFFLGNLGKMNEMMWECMEECMEHAATQ